MVEPGLEAGKTGAEFADGVSAKGDFLSNL